MAKKKIASKIAASSLILSMILAATGCNGSSLPGLPGAKTTKKATVVEEDSVWYDASSVIVDPGIDTSRELDNIYTSFIGVLDGMLLLRTQGSYKMPDDFDWETDDYSLYSIDKVVAYDTETGNTSDLIDLIGMSGSDGDTYYGVSDINIVEGKLVGSMYEYDSKTWEESQSEFTIDPATGECSDPVPVETQADGDKYLENSVKVGDTLVNFYYVYDNMTYTSTYEIYAKGEDGKEKQLDLKVEDEIYGFSFVFPIDDSTALSKAWTNGADIYVIVDLDKGTVEEADQKDYEWLDDVGYIYEGLEGEDGKIYTASSDGIYAIDFSAKEAGKVLDYSSVGISRAQIEYMDLVSYSEDKIVLAGSAYKYNAYDTSWGGEEYQVVTLTKADKNPNAGKTILELYTLGGYADNCVYDAITEYNNADKDYFILVTDDYDINKYYDNYSNLNSEDDYEEADLEVMSGLSDELAVDLINGEGPDIILNAAALGQLNNDNYLADLSGYIKELDSDEYFTNIIEASYTGDKLYQLPFTFYVNGIQTSSDNAGASGVGFTLDEYVDFVDDACNGTDPIGSGQNIYFLKLFNESSADFIKDGKVDFSGEEFAALAEYCKDNAPEKSLSYDEQSPDEMYYDNDVTYAAMAVTTYGLGDYLYYLNNIEGRGDAILGYPSVDGKGPSAAPGYSAAISASAVDVDACWDFIKTLLSDDMQTEMAESGYNVLNKAAFDSVTDAAVEYYNEMYSDDFFYGVGVGAPSKPDKYSADDAEAYKEIVEGITVMNTSDASISKIISEEMPAYFSGQKDLDSVIEIMQDRVQKVLDERG